MLGKTIILIISLSEICARWAHDLTLHQQSVNNCKERAQADDIALEAYNTSMCYILMIACVVQQCMGYNVCVRCITGMVYHVRMCCTTVNDVQCPQVMHNRHEVQCPHVLYNSEWCTMSASDAQCQCMWCKVSMYNESGMPGNQKKHFLWLTSYDKCTLKPEILNDTNPQTQLLNKDVGQIN